MILSERHRELLAELAKRPRIGYGTNTDADLAELIRVGLVKDTSVNLSEILYEITDAGRKACES
jgi:hypothetical protein